MRVDHGHHDRAYHAQPLRRDHRDRMLIMFVMLIVLSRDRLGHHDRHGHGLRITHFL